MHLSGQTSSVESAQQLPKDVPGRRTAASGMASEVRYRHRRAPFVQVEPECANCPLLKLFLPAGLSLEETRHLNRVIHHNRPIKRNRSLFNSGGKFEFLFAVRSGYLKSQIRKPDGSERLLGFHMAGDLVGMDGTTTGEHGCDAIALQDSSLCRFSYRELEELTAVIPKLEQTLDSLIMREVVQLYGNILTFTKMQPNERLALFLHTLSIRNADRGYPRTRFRLRMPYKDLSNHLGLSIKSLNNVFSRFLKGQLIEVRNRSVKIKAPGHLEKIIENQLARRATR